MKKFMRIFILSFVVLFLGIVNTNVEGRYNVVYFATDSNGNVSTKVTRLVYVRF